MSTVFKKALSMLIGPNSGQPILKIPKNRPFKALTERELISLESEIGAKLFGPIPANHRREFFCLDEKTWIWYEEAIDVETGKKVSTTTRYEVHENGILKAQEGAQYSFLEGDELRNLALAVEMYQEQVARNVYKRDPHTGQKLV